MNKLLLKSKILRSIGLATTIRSARDIFREEISGYLLNFLNCIIDEIRVDVTGQHTYKIFPREVFRHAIYSTLHLRGDKLREALLKQFFLPDVNRSDIHRIESLEWGNFNFDMIRPEDRRHLDFKNTARIDILLRNDWKMWKEMRKDFKDLLLNFIVKLGDEAKLVFCVRFAFNYVRIMYNYFYEDREADLSIVSFAVQILTVPTIAQYLYMYTGLVDTICFFIKACFTGFTGKSSEMFFKYYLTVNLNTDSNNHVVSLNNSHSPIQYMQYGIVFQHLTFILSSPLIQSNILREGSFGKYSRLLKMTELFQRLNQQKRSEIEHIEYETNIWSTSFQLSLEVEKVRVESSI